MKKIKLKPVEGMSVVKPDGKLLAKSGEYVEAGTYWKRRIIFGEVELCADEKAKEVKAKPVKKVEKKEVKEDKKKLKKEIK